MKDNTAAVHVQVPVEVTSFLLNEKRTEITKIELKQRVTVLLVPEQAPRDAELQARAPAPGRPAPGRPAGQLHDDRGAERRGRHHAPREVAKPKQEPVIKGVLPDQPAPPPPAAPPVAGAVAAAPVAYVPAPWPRPNRPPAAASSAG